jgi:hypothetical protein
VLHAYLEGLFHDGRDGPTTRVMLVTSQGSGYHHTSIHSRAIQHRLFTPHSSLFQSAPHGIPLPLPLSPVHTAPGSPPFAPTPNGTFSPPSPLVQNGTFLPPQFSPPQSPPHSPPHSPPQSKGPTNPFVAPVGIATGFQPGLFGQVESWSEARAWMPLALFVFSGTYEPEFKHGDHPL